MIKANQVIEIQTLSEKLKISKDQQTKDIQARFEVNTILYLRSAQAQDYIEYIKAKKKRLQRQRLNPISYFRKLIAG